MPALWSSQVWSSQAIEVAECRQYDIAVLQVAAWLDFIIGDPWSWPHPVQFMGKGIDGYVKRATAQTYSPVTMRFLGIGLAILIIGGSAGVSALLLCLLGKVSLLLRGCLEVVWVASCFAGRSLRASAEDVLQPLAADNLQLARERLSLYVGRDTQALSTPDIYRAVLETVSENAIDGVLAPLFYAIVGALFGVAAPFALAYKAASTLDSMVGYREAPYTDLGWFSAKLEDALTWLPCRLSVLTVALLSGRPGHVLRICRRDAVADPSPNAGWSECAYAAALGVQMGGLNVYRGNVVEKPLLADADRPIDSTVIWQALQITRRSFLIGLICGLLCLGAGSV